MARLSSTARAAPSSQRGGLARTAERLGFPAQVLVIASGAGIASFAMNFWIPFLPLYMLQLGATSEANALFWVAFATTGQAIGRVVAGPIWGIFADRFGRKLMYVRALYGASVTTLVAAFATAPWHVGIAYALQGFLSGFIPAAVALTSVLVPPEQLSTSLATVTAAQYFGTTIGPALGAVLAAMLGLRGAMFAGSHIPAAAALWITVVVPRDHVARARSSNSRTDQQGSALRTLVSLQLAVGLFIYFVLYATDQIVRVATPLRMEGLASKDHTAATGLVFAVGGVGSIIGALLIARWVVRPVRLRVSLAAIALVNAATYLLLAGAGSVGTYLVWFGIVEAAHGVMIPATNTIIATAAPAERRGTVFGIASSVQAAAFAFGPSSAAVFAAFSLAAGFVAVGALFALTALVLLLFLRPQRAAAVAA